LVVDFGGGIKTEEDVKIVLSSGAAYVTIGSMAVNRPDTFSMWMQTYSSEKFLLGADVKNECITIGGWLETTDISIFDFLEGYLLKGIRQVFCTDVSKDGRLEGPSVDLYKKIRSRFPDLYFIASGGVSSMDDLISLKEIGCHGAIVGKAIYEGRIQVKDLEQFI
jgi:phosphoribosylformimino-5-aminoimidazole carboxamide ribotide isomerase